MSKPVLILTTCDQRDILAEIAVSLVEKKLAACCQIGGPLISIYRWQDRIENAEEWVCQIKTLSSQLENVTSEIKRFHSYDEPEIVTIEIAGGSESYLRWLESESGGYM